MIKKILHIQVLPKLSGVQKISLEILKSLPNDKYEKWILFSDVIDAGDKNACRNAFEKAGVKVLFSSTLKRDIGFGDIKATKEIYQLCKKEGFDIVHTHSTKPGIVGRIAASFAGVPVVIHTVHGLAFHKFIKFPKWQFYWGCEMFASFFCKKIILVNNYYSKYFNWFKSKTITIYNGIDFNELIEVDGDKSNLKILFVGRLDTPKDPLSLLAAASLVVEKFPKIIFTLVGDGEKYNECRDYIIKNKLDNNIKLEGWQNNVAKYYGSHDIFFAPSIYESFGLMFVEAGYYKLPIVSTNVEGVPEVVLHNKTGLLCEPKDVQSMANNLISLIENKDLRIEMGLNGYERVHKYFSSQIMVNNYKDIYEALLE